jgi:hypothetical protein
MSLQTDGLTTQIFYSRIFLQRKEDEKMKTEESQWRGFHDGTSQSLRHCVNRKKKRNSGWIQQRIYCNGIILPETYVTAALFYNGRIDNGRDLQTPLFYSPIILQRNDLPTRRGFHITFDIYNGWMYNGWIYNATILQPHYFTTE